MTRDPRMFTTYPGELGAGPRVGGLFQGPTSGETLRIWDGRPPQLDPYWGPRVLAISLRTRNEQFETSPVIPDPIPPGAPIPRSVQIEAEASDGFGGKIRRVFWIGEGLSADLNMGAYRLVKVHIVSAIPANMDVFFSWTDLPAGLTGEMNLVSYIPYPTKDTRIALPEGAYRVIFEAGGTITWTIDAVVPGAATFDQAVLAAQLVPVLWGSLSFDQDTTNLIVLLRGF